MIKPKLFLLQIIKRIHWKIYSWFTADILYFNHHSKNTKRQTFKLLKDLPQYSTEWEERHRTFSEAIAIGLLDDIDSSNLTYTTVEINDIVEVNKNQ